MKLLIVSGSSRQHSLNTTLARCVAALHPDDEVRLDTDVPSLPFYDGDLEAAGIPGTVASVRAQVAAADRVVIVTHEYNRTVPGLLGNAVDWLSRPAGHSVLAGKPVLVLSASPTHFGGVRAAEHLRGVLARVGAEVFPTGVSVAHAHQRLDEHPDAALMTELAGLLMEFTATVPRAISKDLTTLEPLSA